MLALLVGTAQAGNSVPIRYPDSAWDPRVLTTLQKGPLYLGTEVEFNLPAPPANDSATTRQELETLREYQKHGRSQEQIEKIYAEAAAGEFSEIYLEGGPFTPAMKRAAAHVLKMADHESQYFIIRDKHRFARPRPSQLATDLTLVVDNPGHAAYPSGHATQSMLMSLIAAEIDPAHAEEYERYAKSIAQRREIAGVHYPSDSEAGQLLAKRLLPALMNVPDFKEALTEAQNQFRSLSQ
ncbi:phosphatase PAP2 family protein [Neptuniibacter sp. CAU 1671]|uniref:phosphatase PAP2 family protein n=1 Tax=Neptuniibacter sp. CAU 1671 TaxID=3032593 RepID=UPI0023DC29A4|nr:phosphatase PAP2 family protein [Neptuniibacter sp. CAU 1671]MDF2182519.1 phosphatase PAP2 family protein [Neptuniibacter sp. CAU 1671]